MSSVNNMAEQFGYSDAVRHGDLVFCSGQIGLEEDGTPPLDPARQFELAFETLGRVLAEAGCTPVDLLEMTSFHTNYPQHMEEFIAAKAAFQQGARPAWTAVGVAALGLPDTIVEIKVVARAGDRG